MCLYITLRLIKTNLKNFKNIKGRHLIIFKTPPGTCTTSDSVPMFWLLSSFDSSFLLMPSREAADDGSSDGVPAAQLGVLAGDTGSWLQSCTALVVGIWGVSRLVEIFPIRNKHIHENPERYMVGGRCQAQGSSPSQHLCRDPGTLT